MWRAVLVVFFSEVLFVYPCFLGIGSGCHIPEIKFYLFKYLFLKNIKDIVAKWSNASD
ncbi:hypothetical protein DDB_G0276199 [Dictyostelium discoideum AX4]|uniref:Uncharacterized protein n=1 Tax=Dictyostelium discoideum TaxID=44689 RepID=Q552I6_DICDI|nr:hypothetical protein DDB_G0276199 [Dictyostelium discoideum AX4]EAL69399.1 hypothetical protein DDB_G0276199 [Dictyostelium discoideum AX4]|eukprot:XP_643294.1 hypothetical protein DDB_G0276199 [Dictyostelium discoideum AX4]